MKNFEFNVAALATSAAILTGITGCGEADAEKVRKNANYTEQSLKKEIKSNESISLLPGIVEISNEVKLRDLPAKINTVNTALINEVPSAQGNFVMFRPYVVRNDTQLDDKQPEYWLAAHSPNDQANLTRTEGLVFLGINSSTLRHIKYYVKDNQSPGQICTDGIKNTFESPVFADSDGASIEPDGFSKDVGLIKDLSENKIEDFMNTDQYRPIEPCRD